MSLMLARTRATRIGRLIGAWLVASGITRMLLYWLDIDVGMVWTGPVAIAIGTAAFFFATKAEG